MILVTGPTGSGKTTTLYALLARHHKPEVNIVTVEDPIEYQLAGINQVQVNTKAGLTFASALRSILRQDPDVILVGEMRDRETVEIAFQAAMTGHMVLSTLHTNSAVAAVTRLLDLGVDSTILATSLTMVIAQRLVRRICDECREAYEPGHGGAGPRRACSASRRRCTAAAGARPAAARGSPGASASTRSSGRPTPSGSSSTTGPAKRTCACAARQGGMVPLREDALAKIKAGITSPDEVLRVVQVDENEMPVPGLQGAHRGRLRHVPVLPQEPEDELRGAAGSRCASSGSCARTATRTPLAARTEELDRRRRSKSRSRWRCRSRSGRRPPEPAAGGAQPADGSPEPAFRAWPAAEPRVAVVPPVAAEPRACRRAGRRLPRRRRLPRLAARAPRSAPRLRRPPSIRAPATAPCASWSSTTTRTSG